MSNRILMTVAGLIWGGAIGAVLAQPFVLFSALFLYTITRHGERMPDWLEFTASFAPGVIAFGLSAAGMTLAARALGKHLEASHGPAVVRKLGYGLAISGVLLILLGLAAAFAPVAAG